MKRTSFGHEFVEFIPPDLREGTLYVSVTYATAVHLCACGCGNRVVTPISPADWQLLFDGDSVSLTPSIGNWAFPCQSHYWLRAGAVRWAPRWTARQIADGRQRDSSDRDAYFTRRPAAPDHGLAPDENVLTPAGPGLFAKLRHALTRRPAPNRK